jgi:diguanylate cyclase (GGDEF)-like protein
MPTSSDIPNEALTEIEIYSREVLETLISENLSPTPSNFSLYFDRLLEDKNTEMKNKILSIIELDESNDDESTAELEQSLKQGFLSIKNILGITANLYKNMSLMTKILNKRKKELTLSNTSRVLTMLEADISKLHTIIEKQSNHMKGVYEETAAIVKEVEKGTKFDNTYGVYNKRYLLIRLEREIASIKKFKYTSSLIFVELSKNLIDSIKSEKALALMTKTVARILLKTSRRSDIVAHYGDGRFSMLLKHTDIENAKRASARLVDLVSNSNFFLADKEIQLKVSIGITDIDATHTVEETIVAAIDGVEKAYKDQSSDYAVMLKDGMESSI